MKKSLILSLFCLTVLSGHGQTENWINSSQIDKVVVLINEYKSAIEKLDSLESRLGQCDELLIRMDYEVKTTMYLLEDTEKVLEQKSIELEKVKTKLKRRNRTLFGSIILSGGIIAILAL